MPCSHAGGSSFDKDEDSRELERRNFMKSALMIGGGNAMHSAMERADLSTAAGGAKTAGERDNRQHAWNPYLGLDARGLPDAPGFHVLLFLDYLGDGEPTAEDRAEMEAALRQLEEAFGWGSDGLLFTVNYGQPYWDRFDEDLPEGARLLDNEESAEAMLRDDDEDVPTVEPYDLFVDLASDHVPNLLAAEEALWGGVDDLYGVSIDATLEGIFERPREYPARRTGFVAGDDDEALPGFEDDEDAPTDGDAFLTLGFQSGHVENQPSEDRMSLVHDQVFDGEPRPPGQFAQGTVQHASRLEMDVGTWYDDDPADRERRMYGPDEGTTGAAVTGLETSGVTGFDGGVAARGGTTVEGPSGSPGAAPDDEEAVGHQQKVARARTDLGTRSESADAEGEREPVLLRRDFNTMDGFGDLLPTADRVDDEGRVVPERSALYFLALMRFNEDMVATRRAMNDIGFDGAGGDDGIHGFVETIRRGNFLVPPIALRSLPTPRAIPADATVESGDGDTLRVRVALDGDADAGDVDVDTVRFGDVVEVDQARGAEPVESEVDDGDLVLEFPADETGVSADDDRARLFAKTDDGVAVTATL